jgi:hypothetical protein
VSESKRPNPIANHRRRPRLRLLPALLSLPHRPRSIHTRTSESAAGSSSARQTRPGLPSARPPIKDQQHTGTPPVSFIPSLHCAAPDARDPLHHLRRIPFLPGKLPSDPLFRVSLRAALPPAAGSPSARHDSWIRRPGSSPSTAVQHRFSVILLPLPLVWQRTPASTSPLSFFLHGD